MQISSNYSLFMTLFSSIEIIRLDNFNKFLIKFWNSLEDFKSWLEVNALKAQLAQVLSPAIKS